MLLHLYALCLCCSVFFVKNSNGASASIKGIQYRYRRQNAPFDELIHSALQLVKPILGNAKQSVSRVVALQQQQQQIPSINAKKPSSSNDQQRLSSARLREIDILGINSDREAMPIPDSTSGEWPPICQGQSRICRFIACSAHNFKHNQNFANLQLAAQLLGDPKLRRTVSANAGAIGEVCREQGMGQTQCALFSRTFQLIDRFMTTLEDGKDAGRGGPAMPDEEDDLGVEREIQTMLRNISSNSPKTTTPLTAFTTDRSHAKTPPLMDDDVADQIISSTAVNRSPVAYSQIGSRTWSTHNTGHFSQPRRRMVPNRGVSGTTQNEVPVRPIRRTGERSEKIMSSTLITDQKRYSHDGFASFIYPPKQNLFATSTTARSAKKSQIPEAEEFEDEEEELANWQRRFKDDDDYYDEILDEDRTDKKGRNGEEQETAVRSGRREGTGQGQQQLENCLQHLGR